VKNKREKDKIRTKPDHIKKKREASKVAWCLLGSDGEGDWKSWVRWWSGEK
nr:hypothetical protein [Tanacetum cinerariifolium]